MTPDGWTRTASLTDPRAERMQMAFEFSCETAMTLDMISCRTIFRWWNFLPHLIGESMFSDQTLPLCYEVHPNVKTFAYHVYRNRGVSQQKETHGLRQTHVLLCSVLALLTIIFSFLLEIWLYNLCQIKIKIHLCWNWVLTSPHPTCHQCLVQLIGSFASIG